MSHKTAVSLIIGAVVVCAAYGTWHLLGNHTQQRTDDAYITADSVLIAPRVSGLITAVAVVDNQPVKAGQLLAELDNEDFLAREDAAAAAVEAAQAQIANLTATIERQAALIDQAGATVRASAASLSFAEANAQRYRNLSRAGAGTQQESQQAEAELHNWQAARERDQAARLASEKTLDVLKAQRQMAHAELAGHEAALKQARLNVSYTRIVAPRDGMVGQRSVRVGAYVAAGKPLMALVPLKEAFVVANFRETQLAHMHAGQSVDIQVDSFPDQRFQGHIDSVAPATGLAFSAIAPDNATGNFTKIAQRIPVKITLDAEQAGLDHLRAGMSVVVSVDTAQEMPQ